MRVFDAVVARACGERQGGKGGRGREERTRSSGEMSEGWRKRKITSSSPLMAPLSSYLFAMERDLVLHVPEG